ncbi:hypothetical protein EON64_14285 [archaeon]|nr:MAG: hypothetical protein EON64_14285 [archaeon]
MWFVAERSEEAAKALATKREYQDKIQQIARDFEEVSHLVTVCNALLSKLTFVLWVLQEKKITYEITQDMTRQYKGMQEELLSRVSGHWHFLSPTVAFISS